MTKITQADVAEAIQAVKTAQKQTKKVHAEYGDVAKSLAAAIKDRNEAMVALYRPRLVKITAEIAGVLQSVEHAIASVTRLQDDEAFAEKQFATLEKLMSPVSKARTTLTKALVDGKKLERAALRALDEMTGDAEDAASEYSRLEHVANDLQKRLDRTRPVAKKLERDAQKAIAAKDQAALTKARTALLDFELGKLRLIATTNLRKVEVFLKKNPKSELARDARALADRLQSMQDDLAQLEKMVLDLVRVGQVAAKGAGVDVVKAAKLLGIGERDRPKLAKVLEKDANAYERNLAALAGKLGLEETNGKKLVARLRKARLIGV